MGFLDGIDRKGREKERARSQRDMENLLTFFQDYGAEGLDDVLSDS